MFGRLSAAHADHHKSRRSEPKTQTTMAKDERRKVRGHMNILARKPASIVNPSPLYSSPLKLATSQHNQTLLKAFAFRRIPLPFTIHSRLRCHRGSDQGCGTTVWGHMIDGAGGDWDDWTKRLVYCWRGCNLHGGMVYSWRLLLLDALPQRSRFFRHVSAVCITLLSDRRSRCRVSEWSRKISILCNSWWCVSIQTGTWDWCLMRFINSQPSAARLVAPLLQLWYESIAFWILF